MPEGELVGAGAAVGRGIEAVAAATPAPPAKSAIWADSSTRSGVKAFGLRSACSRV